MKEVTKESENISKCDICGQKGVFIPPPQIDKISRLQIVNFKCINNHSWQREIKLK